MEFKSPNQETKSEKTRPPRRGDIKVKIFKSIARSAAEILTLANGSKKMNGGSLFSTSTTPHETPSGFTSDADFD